MPQVLQDADLAPHLLLHVELVDLGLLQDLDRHFDPRCLVYGELHLAEATHPQHLDEHIALDLPWSSG